MQGLILESGCKSNEFYNVKSMSNMTPTILRIQKFRMKIIENKSEQF